MEDEMDKKILIGEMAKIHNISTQTLRYYDSIGLLKPRHKDEENGYRYYDIEQFAQLDSILFLKKLGMPLKDIKKYFSNRNLKILIDLLNKKEKDIDKEIELLERYKKSISKKLEFLEESIEEARLEECELIELEDRDIIYISLNDRTDIYSVEYGIKELSNRLGDNLCLFDGRIGAFISQEDILNKRYTTFRDIALIFEHGIFNHKNIKTLHKGRYARIIYRGLYDYAETYFNKLIKFMDINGLESFGDGIVLTITDSAFSSKEEEYLTEIQIPLK